MLNRERYLQLVNELQEVEFTLVELNLYMDVHPDCPQARAAFSEHSARLRQLKKQFDEEIAPLLNFGWSDSDGSWVYTTPWPWELQ